MNKIVNKNVGIYFILIIISFIFVLINTAMSPLYDLSYMTHDASVFYVIGRGMKEGLLPYKDLFDHKGIYIYFLYYLAALIGEKNSIGLFVVFSVLVSFFTVFVYKIARLYKNEFISFFSAITISMISTSIYYSHGALLCEYVALVTITISICTILKYINTEEFNKGFKPSYMFVNGVLAAINIFNKANYTLYFVAVGIFVLVDYILIKKNIKRLIINIFAGIFGLLIGLIPGIIYCIVTGCFEDMVFAVFTFNFSYVDDISIDLPEEVTTKSQAFIYTLKRYINTYLIIIVSILVLLYRKVKKQLLYFYVLSLLCISISVFLALTGYTHYSTLLIPFIMPSIILFYEGVVNNFIKPINDKKILKVVFVGFIFIITFSISYLCGGEQTRMNWYTTSVEARKVKKEISKYIKLNNKSKVLCLGFGSSYYNYLEVIPKEKYFYAPGISYKKFKDPIDSMWKNVMEFKSDVINYATNDAILGELGEGLEKFLNENYVIILDLSKYRKIYVRKEIFEKTGIKNEKY